MQGVRMVRLVTVRNTFHARVIAARLGAEGIVTELRGVDDVYPVGEVHVFVGEEDLEPAQELLMADEVESAFDQPESDVDVGHTPRELWILLAAVVVLAALMVARSI